jgi:hypothetical protein
MTSGNQAERPPSRRVVWTAETTRGRIDLAIEPADANRWRYSLLRHRKGRVEPLSQGLSEGRRALTSDVEAALSRAGVGSPPVWLRT